MLTNEKATTIADKSNINRESILVNEIYVAVIACADKHVCVRSPTCISSYLLNFQYLECETRKNKNALCLKPRIQTNDHQFFDGWFWAFFA